MIRLTAKTATAIGQGAQGCDSRSLLAERFVFFQERMNEARQIACDTFVDGGLKRLRAMREGWQKQSQSPKQMEREEAESGLAATQALSERKEEPQPCRAFADRWSEFLRQGLLLKTDELLFAQLQSRLMVNMAGGVVENAGLFLDRFSGLPVIPGSAVKGCARRMAIEELRQATDDKKPTGEIAALLADIASAFGWGAQDWQTREQVLRNVTPRRDEDDASFEQRCQTIWEERRSDFAFACGDRWPELRGEARKRLQEAPNDFAGAVSFLPAWPVKVKAENLPAGAPPELGKLELDILTCHHPKYYERKDPYASAPDTEEPKPVVFPAVAAGHVFVFAVRPLRRDEPTFSQPKKGLVEIAREWLRDGLGTCGLGAKTAAGYGWFEAPPEFNASLREQEKLKADEELKRRRAENEAEEARARLVAEQAAVVAKRATLAPDSTWQQKFLALRETDRRAIINQFAFDDARFWPTKGELADETIQFSLLHFLLKVEPDFLATDRANRKSKLAKALAGLARKYPSLAEAGTNRS